MPMYLGKEVSEEYMKSLVDAYRKGFGTEADSSDQVIIDRLTEKKVMSPDAPSAVELGQKDRAHEVDEEKTQTPARPAAPSKGRTS